LPAFYGLLTKRRFGGAQPGFGSVRRMAGVSRADFAQAAHSTSSARAKSAKVFGAPGERLLDDKFEDVRGAPIFLEIRAREHKRQFGLDFGAFRGLCAQGISE
jgi:hypothetical protein